jgi:wobble nucleotide-excising tRNase
MSKSQKFRNLTEYAINDANNEEMIELLDKINANEDNPKIKLIYKALKNINKRMSVVESILKFVGELNDRLLKIEEKLNKINESTPIG